MARKRISDIIDAEAAMELAFKNSKLQVKRVPPTVDTAIKCVIEAIEYLVTEKVITDVQPKLNDEYLGYTSINGEWADGMPGQSDYESGLDDVAEQICEPYEEYLSQDWLGKNTIGTSLWEEDGVLAFCKRLGKEYYAGLVHDNDERGKKSPAKILSSAGITQDLVEAWLGAHLENSAKDTPQQEQEPMAEGTELQTVLEKIAAHVGKDYDILEVMGDLDLASDDDDILAQGAAPRLGIDNADIEVLRNERLIYGNKTGEEVEKQLKEIASAGKKARPGKPGKKTTPAAEKPKSEIAKVKDKRKKDEDRHENGDDEAVSILVLSALKECGAADGAMADALGLSRATYNGYANGKVEFKPNEDQLSTIRTELVNRVNKLGEALKELDGTDVEFVV